MGEDSDQSFVLYLNDGVLVKSHSSSSKNDVDFLNNLGTLSIRDYKTEPGKCIEWHQCDVSIESDDQEWAIVKDNKCENALLNGNKNNSKPPNIQIQFKNLLSFKVKNNQQLTLVEQGGSASTTFFFQNSNANRVVDFLKTYLNITVFSFSVVTLTAADEVVETSMNSYSSMTRCYNQPSKKDLNLYMVRNQKEVETLEKSFAELDLFSDDNTRTDAIWSFLKKWQTNPYETTLCAFSKVTDTFLYKSPSQEIDNVAELLNRSLTTEEFNESNGKISTEDYELITKGTPLPPRTLPLRSSPLTINQWEGFFDESGRITQPETVKELIFHGGISSEDAIRSEVWKFLLGYYPWDSTYAERKDLRKRKKEEYMTMKLQWKSMTPTQEDNFMAYRERKSLIEKDVCRTDRHMPFFAGDNNPSLDILQDILMTYVLYNFDLGYVQGMSDLLSPLLVELVDEVDTFWCFVGFMNKVSRNFDLDQAGMKQQLQQLYCLLCWIEPELAIYLEQQDSNNMSFCFRWLLIWFKREFSYKDIYVLWEALWTGLPCENFHLLVSAAILDTEKDTLISKHYGFTEILKHVNELANKINLDMILRKAEGIYVQLSTAARIPAAVREIIGLEPLPELEMGEPCDERAKEKTKSPNGAICGGPDYISEDSQELAFDNSISLQYL